MIMEREGEGKLSGRRGKRYVVQEKGEGQVHRRGGGGGWLRCKVESMHVVTGREHRGS